MSTKLNRNVSLDENIARHEDLFKFVSSNNVRFLSVELRWLQLSSLDSMAVPQGYFSLIILLGDSLSQNNNPWTQAYCPFELPSIKADTVQ
jgi:hypothetical protein